MPNITAVLIYSGADPCPGTPPYQYQPCNEVANAISVNSTWWVATYSDHPEFATMGAQVGDVLIVDEDTGFVISKIQKSNVKTAAVNAAIEVAEGLDFVPGENYYVNDAGTVFVPGGVMGEGGNGSEDCTFRDMWFIGDSLSFLCDWEKYLWWAAAAFGAVNFINAPDNARRVLWGAATAGVSYKALGGKIKIP